MQRYSYRFGLLFCGVLLALLSGLTSVAWACRVLEPPSDAVETYWVHLEGFCFSSEQHDLAIKGAEILEALKAGKSLNFRGALVVDDVMLDQLPLQAVAEIAHLPDPIRERLERKGLERVRVIPGSIIIEDSQFEKLLATNLVDDVLVILGDVAISQTTFLQSVDFSKIIFAEPVLLTNVQVTHEGFFIGAQFEQSVDFSHTTFGTHSRFHKAVFRAPVTFAEVQFQGVAEFLEVEFQQAANFSQTHFLSGTGFSGSVFHGPADFSEMEAKQEIYFRFSEFQEQVTFSRAQFRSVLDFSNSHFGGEHNFSEAEFAVAPDFTASNISPVVSVSGRRLHSESQWLLFAGLVLFVSLYLWITKRRSKGHSA